MRLAAKSAFSLWVLQVYVLIDSFDRNRYVFAKSHSVLKTSYTFKNIIFNTFYILDNGVRSYRLDKTFLLFEHDIVDKFATRFLNIIFPSSLF